MERLRKDGPGTGVRRGLARGFADGGGAAGGVRGSDACGAGGAAHTLPWAGPELRLRRHGGRERRARAGLHFLPRDVQQLLRRCVDCVDGLGHLLRTANWFVVLDQRRRHELRGAFRSGHGPDGGEVRRDVPFLPTGCLCAAAAAAAASCWSAPAPAGTEHLRQRVRPATRSRAVRQHAQPRA